MKKEILLVVFVLVTTSIFGQVSFTVIEPASIAGGYEFTSNGDGPNWGLANLNDPNDAVQDTVVIVDDGLPGINAQGIPHANEGCNPLINDLTGKIAFVYRYDGSSTNACYAGTKVLNAQNAGAVGVILVNRTEGVYGYNGTTDGPLTTIPFAFISKSDGEIIRAKLDAGEDVVAFIGSKLGLHNDDVGIVKNNTIAPIYSALSSKTAGDASEFGFDVGTTVYNYGQNAQNNVNITASVNGPGGFWSETVGPYSIPVGDSVNVFTGGTNDIPAFSLNSYPNGTYYLNYSVSIGLPDESDFDNEIKYDFTLSDGIISYCKMDTVNLLPEANTYLRSNDDNFAACLVYNDENASRLLATGMHFSPGIVWDSDQELENTIADVVLFRWDDNFTDLNDPSFSFDNIDLIASGTHTFVNSEEDQMIFVPYEQVIQFNDNQRYLACVQTYESFMTLGFSSRINYFRNVNQFLQPITPVAANSAFFARGFGEERVPAIALEVVDADELSMESQSDFDFKIYPNPATNNLYIKSTAIGEGLFTITDLTGRMVQSINFNSNNLVVNIADLRAGIYFLNYSDSNGEIAFRKFVKR